MASATWTCALGRSRSAWRAAPGGSASAPPSPPRAGCEWTWCAMWAAWKTTRAPSAHSWPAGCCGAMGPACSRRCATRSGWRARCGRGGSPHRPCASRRRARGRRGAGAGSKNRWRREGAAAWCRGTVARCRAAATCSSACRALRGRSCSPRTGTARCRWACRRPSRGIRVSGPAASATAAACSSPPMSRCSATRAASPPPLPKRSGSWASTASISSLAAACPTPWR